MEIHQLCCLLVSLTASTSLVSARVFGGLFQSSSPCETGTKVSCMIPPCSASNGCSAFPNAECRNNYCGGCNAQYWVGNNEVTAQCDVVQGGRDVLALSKADETNCLPVRCFVNPCDTATCAGRPSAICRQHKCECSATFWEGLTDVSDQCTSSITDTRALLTNSGGGMMSNTECGNVPKVHCSVNPCDVETCPDFPQAQCRTNYCGGCSAEFWVDSKDVSSQCNAGNLVLNTGGGMGPVIASRKAPRIPEPVVDPIPPTRKPCLSSCFFPPCRFSYCAAFPNAECRDDYCGGCKARYYMDNVDVTLMCNDQVPTLGRLFSNRRRQQRTRSVFSPWFAFLDGMF